MNFKDHKNDILEYILLVFGSIAVAALLVLLFSLLTGCRLIREHKSDSTVKTSDSSTFKKQSESSNKVDTSKSKSETTYLKETYIYPPRDTIVNNYYPASPAVYIRESGNKKDETQNYNYDQRLKEVTDSMKIASLQQQVNEQSKSKTSFAMSPVLWVLIGAVGLFIVMRIIPLKINRI